MGGPPAPRVYVIAMTVEKNLFDSPEAEAKSEARAEADVRAGRLISHEAVRRWLSSWGSEAAAEAPSRRPPWGATEGRNSGAPQPEQWLT
ncbi:MAG: hypothetical protein QOH47_3483 [Sphingomonadales bacterium]|nr:hypothetical protein [Sphingomonadales bacterium]